MGDLVMGWPARNGCLFVENLQGAAALEGKQQDQVDACVCG